MKRRDFIGGMLALAGGTAFGDEYVAVKNRGGDNRGGDCPRFHLAIRCLRRSWTRASMMSVCPFPAS